jgi:hypothetical protein
MGMKRALLAVACLFLASCQQIPPGEKGSPFNAPFVPQAGYAPPYPPYTPPKPESPPPVDPQVEQLKQLLLAPPAE